MIIIKTGGTIWEKKLCNFYKDWELKKETTFAFGYFSTTSGHFFTIYICIFHKILVLTVILRGWTYLNPNWIKIYDINYKMVWQVCFLYLEEKKNENLRFKNGHFLTICGHFLAITWISFTKLKFRRSFWGAYWV